MKNKMKNKMKKVMALTLATMVFVTGLTACGT